MAVIESAAHPRGAARVALAANAWLVFSFLYAPIALPTVLSFNDSRPVGGWQGVKERTPRGWRPATELESAARSRSICTRSGVWRSLARPG